MNFKVGLMIAIVCVRWTIGSKPGTSENKAPAIPNPQKTDVLRQLSTSFEEISQTVGPGRGADLRAKLCSGRGFR